ncbi:MAG TPA: hypothetical protein ENJ95_00800 [Bacteroidetes bacterium]|nr:hypothetical protein [Bacteroidota bacterium]
MTNFEIADKIHLVAMELADLADIARSRKQDDLHLQNLEQAYILEKEAALRLQSEPDENEWKFLFLKSAGWLAYQLGRYGEALELAEIGLAGETGGLPLYRLKELKETVAKKMKEIHAKQSGNHLFGMLASADVEQEKVTIKENGNRKLYTLNASRDLIQKTARHLIGEWVEIDLTTKDDGGLVLRQIRRAA